MNKIIKIIAVILSIGIVRYHSIGAMAAGGLNPDQQLLQGAQSGDLAQVQNALNHGASIDAVDANNNTTALIYAVSHNHLDIVQLLLEYRANPNLVDTDGCTALHYAVVRALPTIVKLLLDNGSDPTIRDTSGQTAADMLVLVSNLHLYQCILKHFDEALSSTSQDILDLIDQVVTLHY